MEKSKIRKSIVKAIQLIAANSNQNIQDVENMIEAWHIVLELITDKQIGYGLKKALDNSSPFMITAGEFKELIVSDDGSDRAKKKIEATQRLLNE